MSEKGGSEDVEIELRQPLSPSVIPPEQPKSDASMWHVLGHRIPSRELVFRSHVSHIVCDSGVNLQFKCLQWHEAI